MDWIHCNRCYFQPGPPENRKFVLTNCGHIFCKQCEEESSNICTVCRRECSCILIESGMREDMNLYFQEPEKEIKKQLVVFDFQKNHRMKFFRHLIELGEKTSKYKDQIAVLKDEVQRHRSEKNGLKDEILKISAENRQLKQQVTKLENSGKFLLNQQASQRHSGSMMSLQNSGGSQANRESARAQFRNFGTSLQNTPSFLQRSASSQQLNFRQLVGDVGSSPIGLQKDDSNTFTPPRPVSYQNAYRNSAASPNFTQSIMGNTPNLFSPPSTPTQQYRKVLLPGDKYSTPMGIARLSMRTPTSSAGTNGPPSAIRKSATPLNVKYQKYL